MAASPRANKTVRAAKSISVFTAPFTGKRNRRSADSDSTVCYSAYASVTPPWLSTNFPALSSWRKDGVTLPWLISEGLSLTA